LPLHEIPGSFTVTTNCPSKPRKPAESGHKQGKFGLCIQTQHEHTVDGYNSGVTVKLPSSLCLFFLY
jgi:hypothetical protein